MGRDFPLGTSRPGTKLKTAVVGIIFTGKSYLAQ